MADYKELLPAMPPDQWRRVRGEQEIIVRYEPEEALATLPKLLARRGDRERLVTLVRRLLADERVQRAKPTTRAARDDRADRQGAGGRAPRNAPREAPAQAQAKSAGKRGAASEGG